ncbi:MAG: hypothetical protein DWQ34_07580 [Planctomycetota bacterium]|nr:MAG: hypothetical protein DWQ34_07580 [Planctomycetota bacterium]REJ95577.1 MAG: hypothetical protein DWQ29_01885 [Planctomycetota bacterium]REK30740.1 MAG: hypothetical protein DWQ41_01975 [Planctomycetota bacterium]REK33115.1 MAG: hypothetical protein DWQ45_16080 [Planctomycetota bacterium]
MRDSPRIRNIRRDRREAHAPVDRSEREIVLSVRSGRKVVPRSSNRPFRPVWFDRTVRFSDWYAFRTGQRTRVLRPTYGSAE